MLCTVKSITFLSSTTFLASVNENVSQKEDVMRTMETIPPPLPPPPPSRWNENRAKFSDVVARSQEIVSPYSGSNHVNHKSQTNASAIFNTDVKDVQYAKPAHPMQEMSTQTSKEYSSLMSKPGPISIASPDKDKTHDLNSLILQSDSQHSNSYFVNTFTDHTVSSNFTNNENCSVKT